MQDKWKEYIPLTLLTTAHLKASEPTRKHQTPVCLTSGKKGLELTATTEHGLVPPKEETAMDFQEWLQAWNHLLDLIDIYMPQSTEAWERHWKMIWQHRERDTRWHCLMRYCIEVRKAAVRINMNPGVWQAKIWQEIIDEDRDRIAAGRPVPGTRHNHSNTGSSRDKSVASSQSFQRRSGAPNASDQKPARKPRGTRTRTSVFVVGHTVTSSENATGTFNTTAPRSSSPRLATSGCSTTNHSATGTIHPGAATSPPAATRRTSVRYANQQTTAPKTAVCDPRRVTTLLLPDKWQSELRALGLWGDFSDVPTGLREGFRIGANAPVRETYTPQNHKSALERPQVILDHINTEVAAGRYTGPFERSELQSLIGPFRTAPLGVVDKPSAPGKYRIIQDFSYPRDSPPTHSLNSQIDTKDFTCTWGFFADIAEIIAKLAPGAKGATFDVDAAYRQIPVHPLDQPHIVFRWGESFWVDGRVPFGAASSNGLFGRCGDAMAAIYSRRGFGVIVKWVDDFLFIQAPVSTTGGTADHLLFSEEAIYELAASLGWPWKFTKTRPFAQIFTYLGFEWSIPEKWVRIPHTKREKYLQRASSWLDCAAPDLKETEVLIGTLIHCALALPEGRPYLANLIAFEASFPRAYARRFTRKPAPDKARAEVRWWIGRLAREDCGSSIAPAPPASPLRIYTDASSSFGLGVVIDNEFLAWRLMQGWKSEGRDIGWAEAIAIELAVEWAISAGAHDTSITIHCDNQGVVLAWKAGRLRNRHQNDAFIRLTARCLLCNIHLILVYVNTKDNPADFPSRNKRAPGKSQAASHPRIPTHLIEFVVNASCT